MPRKAHSLEYENLTDTILRDFNSKDQYVASLISQPPYISNSGDSHDYSLKEKSANDHTQHPAISISKDAIRPETARGSAVTLVMDYLAASRRAARPFSYEGFLINRLQGRHGNGIPSK